MFPLICPLVCFSALFTRPYFFLLPARSLSRVSLLLFFRSLSLDRVLYTLSLPSTRNSFLHRTDGQTYGRLGGSLYSVFLRAASLAASCVSYLFDFFVFPSRDSSFIWLNTFRGFRPPNAFNEATFLCAVFLFGHQLSGSRALGLNTATTRFC